jgi:hypothetical protein
MPVRLLELVRKYPYTQGLSSPTTDLQLLPRPRFSTPTYEALFVRIEIEFPKASLKPKSKMHPLNLLADAFSTQVTEGEFAELWAKITAASKNGSSPSPLSNIFADETIRFLSIIPDARAGKSQEAKSPTFTLLPTSPTKKAFSEDAQEQPTALGSQHKKFVSEPVASTPTPISPLGINNIGSDWAQFSSSGFLDSTPAIVPLVSTLFDTDIEKTVPPSSVSVSRKSSKRVRSPRKSIDIPRLSISENGVLGAIQIAEAAPAEDTTPVVKAGHHPVRRGLHRLLERLPARPHRLDLAHLYHLQIQVHARAAPRVRPHRRGPGAEDPEVAHPRAGVHRQAPAGTGPCACHRPRRCVDAAPGDGAPCVALAVCFGKEALHFLEHVAHGLELVCDVGEGQEAGQVAEDRRDGRAP